MADLSSAGIILPLKSKKAQLHCEMTENKRNSFFIHLFQSNNWLLHKSEESMCLKREHNTWCRGSFLAQTPEQTHRFHASNDAHRDTLTFHHISPSLHCRCPAPVQLQTCGLNSDSEWGTTAPFINREETRSDSCGYIVVDRSGEKPATWENTVVAGPTLTTDNPPQ